MKDSILYKISRPIITILFKILYRPTIKGEANIPKEGRIILAGNHTSIMDPLLLISSTKRNIHFLAKKELFKGLKGIYFRHMGLIRVDRSIHDKSVLPLAKKYLESDLVVGIFPEGTISKTKELLDFKVGAVKLAKDTDTFIVPFVISGKYKLFRKSINLIYLEKIKVKESIEIENKNLRELIQLKRDDKN